MNDFDPLKSAFNERSKAAHNLDVEGGLAGLHRHNAPGRRMAKAGGAMVVGLIALGGAGVALSGGGDDVQLDDRVADTAPEVQETIPVDSDAVTPDDSIPDVSITVPPTSAPPDQPVVEPDSTEPPSVIITDASTSVLVDGVRYEMGIGPIVDAIGVDGGVVFATDDAIWQYRANSLESTKLVEAGPAGTVNLLEVEVDAENADTTVFFTEWGGDNNDDPAQYLSKLALGSDTGVQRLARVGGGELAVIDAGVGGQNGGSSLIATVDTTGPCSSLSTFDGTTGDRLSTEMRCVPEGGGDFDFSELYQAVDLTHDGGLVWADGDTLTNAQTGESQPTVEGNPKWIDIWGDWAVVAKRGGQSVVELVNLVSGETIAVDGLPTNFTSARPLRVPIEVAQTPNFEPFTIASDNFVVINVADDDVLNIRSGPGVDYSVEGGIPNGDVVTTSGRAARLASGSEWYEIGINDLGTGWVNARFLEPLETGGAPAACLVDSTGAVAPETAFPMTSAAVESPADHIKTLSQTSLGSGCIRTRVGFGSDFAFDDSGPEAPLPGGLVVDSSPDGRSILVTLPGVGGASPGPMRDGTAVITGDLAGSVSLEILSGRHTAAAFFDTSANELIIDYVALPPATDELPVPLVDEFGIIIRDIDGYSATAAGPVIDGVARVRGFARPFEAQLSVELHDENGEPVDDVLWNAGRSDEFAGAGYFGPQVPWEVLGSFDITFEGLQPGSYTLRFASDATAVADPSWLEIPFTVN